MPTKLDLRQSIYRGTLSRISSTANPEGDNLMFGINSELTPLLQLSATGTNRVVNVGPSVVQNTETGLNRALTTIGSNTPNVTSGTITFPSTPGTVTVSPGNNASFSMGANEYIKALVYLDASNNLNIIFGTSNATEANATVVSPPEGSIAVGFVTIQTISGTVQNITNSKIYQYVGTGAGSGSSGNGVLEPVPGYKMLISDSFSSIQGGSDDTVNQDAGFTHATYDAGKKLYRLSCDKSKTVNTNSGTAFTINLAPSFTVNIGDIVYITSGARSGQWRRIQTVTNQTTYVLDAAFTGGNASNGDTIMISQAVWTLDLVNFGSATELTRPRDFYASEPVNQILIDYTDSLTSGDDVGDFTQTARIVMSASNSGLQTDVTQPTTDLFTSGVYTRPTAPNMLNDYALLANANKQRLFLVFFCNPANGSVTTAANLLDYAVNFYEEAAAINGGVLATAFGTSDNSTTSYNGTISTSASQTRIDLNFDVNPNVDTGGVGAQVAVKVNGQDVPKFVSSAVTPAGSLYYTVTTDANGLYRRILFSLDLSVSPVEIMIIKQFGVVDLSFTQTNKLTGLYDAIVGSASQVSSGAATHSSLQAAHDAVVAGSNILVLNNVTLNGNTTLSKRLMIIGKGPGSNLTGNLTIASGALGSNIKDLRIEGNIAFNSGADKCFMVGCFQANGYSFSNDPSNLDNVLEIIAE